ncbi:MAG: hypothetical protein H0W72_16730, partial [Planctomycetes bacterium]|nr:hypothetical protein [Planctomycetota bacterium]
MTDPLIARLDALAEKSTPGPWETCRTDTHRCLANTSFHSGITAAQVSDDALVPFADADFIAALVTAWPEIRARLAALSTVTDAMVDAALAAEDEAMEPPGYSDRSLMRAA